MIIKKYNGTTWDEQYPKTVYSQLYDTDTITPLFDGGKLNENYLPNSVWGGLKFAGTTTASALSTLTTILEGASFENETATASNYKEFVGWYFVYSANELVDGDSNGTWNTDMVDDGITLDDPTPVEKGDWVIVTGWDSTNSCLQYGVVNNTYGAATTAAAGVVELATSTEAQTGTDTTRALTSKAAADTYSKLGHNHDTAYAAISHTHGNITNDGKVGSTAGLILKTTTDGLVTTLAAGSEGTFLSGAGTYAVPNYSTLSSLGVTATAAELNYVDGVTSNIQTQLNAKQATITGAATTIDTENLTASRALVSDASGKVGVSSTSLLELAYLTGVTSGVQAQLNNKQAIITGAATTIDTENLTVSRALVSDASGKVAVSAVTSTEIGYLDGVTSSIQTQLNAKQATVTPGDGVTFSGNTLDVDYPVFYADDLTGVTGTTNAIGFEW